MYDYNITIEFDLYGGAVCFKCLKRSMPATNIHHEANICDHLRVVKAASM